MADRKMQVSFGLMAIQCRRQTAVETPIKLTNLCVADHEPTPMKQDPSYCPVCGPEDTDKDATVKGHGSGSSWTILDAETLAALETEEDGSTRGYHKDLTLAAHPADAFLADTETGAKIYWLYPEAASADHYALLVRLIESHPELVFAGLMSLSTGGSAYLWSLGAREGVLTLEECVRSEALKPAPAVTGTVNEKLLGMVEASLGMFIAPYDREVYADKHAAELANVIAAGTVTEGATPVATNDDDLMAKLAALSGKD